MLCLSFIPTVLSFPWNQDKSILIALCSISLWCLVLWGAWISPVEVWLVPCDIWRILWCKVESTILLLAFGHEVPWIVAPLAHPTAFFWFTNQSSQPSSKFCVDPGNSSPSTIQKKKKSFFEVASGKAWLTAFANYIITDSQGWDFPHQRRSETCVSDSLALKLRGWFSPVSSRQK